MADFIYTRATSSIATGTWDFSSATPDIRAALVTTNTTLDTEPDIATVAGATTEGELTTSGYTANGIALTSEAANEDAANNRTEFDAADITYSSLATATSNVQAVVVYAFISAFITTSIPIAWVESGFNPTTGIPTNGGDIVVSWNAQGIIQFTSPNAP